MTDEQQVESGEMTERFRAFSQTVDPAPSRALPIALTALAVLGIAVLVVVAMIVFG
jgi:hypothetical protein